MNLLIRFFLFIIILRLLAYFIKKYISVYELSCYIGKKGSGKSCIGAKQLLKYQKKGWICMTDLNTNIPGVHIIKTFDLSKYRPPYHTFVWIDEACITFDNRNFSKTWTDGLTSFFTLQRHYKVVVHMAAQFDTYDKKLRTLLDHLYIIRKIEPFVTWIRPIGRQVKLINSTAEADSRIAQDLYYRWPLSWRFVWLPKYWKYQDSFAAPDRPIIPSKIIPCPMLQDYHEGLPDPKPKFYYPYGKSLNISDYENVYKSFSL